MRVLSVPGLCCPNCAAKIEEALKDSVVKHFEVSLENKTVSVCDCDTCQENAMEILKDLGYECERIS